ncbi:uncharacterized protein ACIBXB_021167 isoform 1-T3 [Morphnus guianensis]
MVPDVAPTPWQGPGVALGGGGGECCKCWGRASRGRSRLTAGQGHGRAMMRSRDVPRGCAVPHSCAMPRGWHRGWHLNGCSREAGLRRVWGGHRGAAHQVTACPLLSRPAWVARGRPARPSTQEKSCASSIARPTRPAMGSCPGAPRVPPTLHPQPTHPALTLGEGWTRHSHAAPWARRGAEKPPRWGLQPSAAAGYAARHHSSLSQAHAASGTCPGGIEPLGTPKPLELGLCSTHEPLTAPGTPLCSFGVSAIARGHIQPPNHSPEGRAPLSPACGAGVGRGRSRSVPPRPRRWLLARARATPSQATSARSLSVPTVLTALRHHPWPGRAGVGWN